MKLKIVALVCILAGCCTDVITKEMFDKAMIVCSPHKLIAVTDPTKSWVYKNNRYLKVPAATAFCEDDLEIKFVVLENK